MKQFLFGLFSVLLIGLSSVAHTAFASTNVTGVVSENTTWTAAASPYILIDKVTIASGTILTLEKGTIVKLGENGIEIHGALRAEGTETEPVFITSIKDDSVGGDTNGDGSNTSPSPGDWQGLLFNAGASGIFNHTVIRYAGYGYYNYVPQISAIHNRGANVVIRDSELAFNQTCAVGQSAGSLVMDHSNAHDLTCGVVALGGSVQLNNNQIKNTSRGLFINGVNSIELTDTIFESNQITADINLSPVLSFVHERNTATGGQFNGIILRGVLSHNLRLTKDTMPYIISGGGGGGGSGGFFLVTESDFSVGGGGTLTVDPGVVVKFHDSAQLIVNGKLSVLGEPDKPISFTSIKDDSIGGDTNGDGIASAPARGDWVHVQFNTGGEGSFENAIVKYGGWNTSLSGIGSGANVYNKGGVVTVRDSELAFGKFTGILHSSGTTTVNQSFIHDNPNYGVFNSSSKVLDATNNYWGDPSGPYHLIQNPTGQGGTVSDNVLFYPWKGAHCTERCFSSVLFLPGIMGSRLYEDSGACGFSGGEKERWFSTTDCQQLRLMTDENGISINDIYTKEGESSVIDQTTFLFPLYKKFLTQLKNWKTEGVIADYKAVPYDWRLRLDDILKTKLDSNGRIKYDVTADYTQSYLYKSLKDLVDHSATGKVTIVTHSNGGLLAKVFLRTLQLHNDPLANKVDTVIMVAAPQAGTPDSLVGVLHGTEIGKGFVVSQETTRKLMNTMPFTYQLLPNAHYFASEQGTILTPAITFETGGLTSPWITTYGAEIKDTTKLYAFLRKESGRVVPATADLLTPAVVDGAFLNYAQLIETIQAGWNPGSTTKLYQVAGTGVETPSGITYFTDRECATRDPLKLFACTSYRAKLGYRVTMLKDGDGTVVVPSALAKATDSGRIEREWVDLDKYSKEITTRVHKDIFEVLDVINFVGNVLQSTTSRPYTYLGTSAPAPSTENRLAFYLHSPLDMVIKTSDGKEVSSSTETIPGAVYRRYGELQYISLPETSLNKSLLLQGTKTGSFTLETEAWTGSTMTKRQTYSAVPSSTSTKVSAVFTGASSLVDKPLVIDYDGNGTPDVQYDTKGIVVTELTYDDLFKSIEALKLKTLYKQLMLATAKIAQQYQQKSLSNVKYKTLEKFTLEVLKQQVLSYEKLRLITTIEKQQVVVVISSLLSK